MNILKFQVKRKMWSVVIKYKMANQEEYAPREAPNRWVRVNHFRGILRY